MKATIADIRRGDRYTHNGTQYIALRDARPSGFDTDKNGRFYIVQSTRATGAKKTDDGTTELTGQITGDVCLKTYPIEIHERGLTVTHRAEAIRDDTPKWQAEQALNAVIRARDLAQRDLDILDPQFRIEVRQFLHSGGTVAEVVEKTGLSRARVYQIRDDRR